MMFETKPSMRTHRAKRRLARVAFALLTAFAASPALAAVDLVLNHSDTGYDPVPAGGIVQYTLRVDNNGSSTATGVTLQDTLPTGTTYVGSTSTQGSCAAPAGGVLDCDLGSIAASGTATVTVQVRSQSAGLITNRASATPAETDTDTSNNLDIQQQTTITQGADLALSVTPSAGSVQAGGILGYSFTVDNNGPDPATSARISASLPPGFAVIAPLPSGCSVSAQTLTCDLSGSIASGGSRTIGPVNGQVAAAGGSTLTVAANVSITSGTAPQDPANTNDNASANTPVTAGSDVRLTKSASVGSPVLTGTTFDYILSSHYTGDNPANLGVTDSVPANFQILSPASFASNGWACTVSGQNVACSRAQGGVAAGDDVAIGDIVIQVRAQSAGNGIINQADISSSTADPDPSDNNAQATLTVVDPTADLYAQKTGPNPALASAGSHWTWTVRLGNNGPAALAGTARMIDTLPVGITVHSYTATNGWACSPAAPFTATSGNRTITCTRDYTAASPLASGARAPSVSYEVSAAAAGSFDNTMCVSAVASGSDTPAADGNSSNDCAGSGVGVQASTDSADLRLLKTASPGTVPAGDVLTYTLEIVNDGPSAAADVVLSDTLDTLINNGVGATGQGFIDATVSGGSSSGGSCSSSAAGSNRRALSCSFTTVPACTQGSDCPVVTVHVRPGGDGGTRTNSADAVSGTTADPDYGNNGASVSSTIDPRADVTVTKTATPDPAVAGQTLTYVITARNAGPSRAQAVGVTDTLPLDVTFVSASPSGGGSCTTAPGAETTTAGGNRTLACGWSSLANNAQQTVTVRVRPNSATRGTTLTNSVDVATTTTETDATNNSASVDVPVSVPVLDLLANVVDNPDPVAVGDPMTYTLTVTNNGPSYAENVQLADTLPSTHLSFVSVSAPSGVSCTTPAVGAVGGTVNCSFATLAAGASTSVTLTMLGVDKGTTTNQLTVRSDETVAGFDTLPANNTTTEQTTVRPKADVSVVSKTAVPGTVGLREAFVYRIVVHNAGPGVADAMQLTDTLPAGMRLNGAPTVTPVDAGDFPSMPATPCSGNAGASSFTCAFGDDVAVGADATVNVPVIVVAAPAGASPGTLTNTASVSTTSKDEVPGNNSHSGAVQVQTATIAGRVYGDANGNGAPDGGESGIGGVTVALHGTAPDGTAVDRTTITAADGSYSFAKLPAGTYALAETQPSGWLDGADVAGSAGGTAAAMPGDDISGATVASSTNASGYDFGELSPGSLGGSVYRDLDNDGAKSGAGETGIAGVALKLTGTDDLGHAVSLNATTDAAGAYSFGNLRPGSYTVTETQPSGFLPGKAAAGSGTADPGTAAADGNSIGTIALAAGQGGTGFDFGELPPTGLSGHVYVDANRNGTRDAAETSGVAGVTVTLTGTDDLGATVNRTATTDGSGAYSFDELRPGTYTLAETQPAAWQDGGDSVGTVGGTPRGSLAGNDTIGSIALGAGESGIDYDFGEEGQGLGGFVYADSNGNGIQDAGEPGIAGVALTATDSGTGASYHVSTDASGAYLFADLPAGTYRIDETQPADYQDGADQVGSLGGTHSGSDTFTGIVLGVSQVGTGYNFGETGGRLAGRVYIDANGNGLRDSGEPGIAGVTVALAGSDVHGNPVSRSAITDASGAYVFTDLLPADGSGYALTETQPAAYADGDEHVGSLGGSAGASGTSTISAIPLGAGAAGNGYDFGERTGAIAGSVYADADNNGVHDAGETGIAGVGIRLSGHDVDGNAVDLTVVTGADGSYAFIGLSKADASGYTLTETQPAAYLDGQVARGSVDAAACGACDIGTANRNASIPFDPASAYTAFDFGELTPASLAGSVYDDLDGNHVRDSGEGLAGVTVTLTGTDDLGHSVSRTATTGADGSYRFDDLRPGTYTATETQPAGLGDVGVRAGSAGGSTATNTVSAIDLDPGTVATGYDFLDHGSVLGGTVFFDKNGNGQLDAGEPGIAGVTVTLGGADSRTAVTGADGSYRFTGLVAGSYTLTETQPVLYKDGGVQVGSAGGSAGTNAVTSIALAAGGAGSGYNFAELTGENGRITGSVWLNKPGGSEARHDSGESGLEGWQVVLYRDGKRVDGVESARTDAAGRYTLTDVPAQEGYELRFLSPNGTYYGYPYSQDPDPRWNGKVDRTAAIPAIAGVTVGSAVTVTAQDLPVDPSGVVYDSVSRKPVSGARVTLLDPSGQPVAAQYLVGGAGNVTQTTGEDGFYQFLLLPGAPAGAYTLRVEVPAGYLPPPSSIWAPAGDALAVPAGNTPYPVSTLDGPPANGDLPPYYLAFVIAADSAGVTGNHVPIDPVLQGALRVRKTTPKVNVSTGDLVPYTIELTNTLAVPLTDIAARDLLPPGFKYRRGSARVDGIAREPQVAGRQLTWSGLAFAANQTRTVQLVLVIGSGVGEGEYTNQAWGLNTLADRVVSNIGTATVRIVPDPTFDCADLIGKVFDDRNANGYQDAGEPGVPDVRLATVRGLLVTTDAEGRYHVPCADTPEHARGANFVMKLDERTLPTGYRPTTENPGDVRLTAGKMAKLNFGVTIHRVVRVDVAADAFDPGGDALLPTWTARLPGLYATLQERPSLLRIAYHLRPGEDRGRVEARLRALHERVAHDWSAGKHRYPLRMETEITEVQP